jgi:hypothetical protein
MVRTTPESVLDDYARSAGLANYKTILPTEKKTLLKINIFMANLVSRMLTTPWQLEGFIRNAEGRRL